MLLSWYRNIPSRQWDQWLSELKGHPLQSALWGDARCHVEGVSNERWAACVGDRVVWMGYFEVRKVRGMGRVAWFPRGPVFVAEPSGVLAMHEALEMLKEEGYLVCFIDPYPDWTTHEFGAASLSQSVQTLWVDLETGEDSVFKGMHKKMRYGVRAAQRNGVILEESVNASDIQDFYLLYMSTSRRKKFQSHGSLAFVTELLTGAREDSAYRARMFLARCEGDVASAYISMENGYSLHNIWSVTDRRYLNQYPGEAALWFQVSTCMAEGVSLYDQEGIDPDRNPGCYQFKKRMGGRVVKLPGIHAFPLSLRGRAMVKAEQWVKRW